MMHHKYLHLYLFLLLLLVSGCTQSPQDKLVELGKCIKASQIIGDPVLAAAAANEFKVIAPAMESKIVINPALFAMLVNEKVNDELYPAGSSTNSKYVLETAASWINSNYCKELRKKVPPPPPPVPKPEMKTVPRVNGNCKDPGEVIRTAGLVPKEMLIHGPEDSDAASIGCAYRQDPAEGTAVKPGSDVSYRVWWESQ